MFLTSEVCAQLIHQTIHLRNNSGKQCLVSQALHEKCHYMKVVAFRVRADVYVNLIVFN